jgi:hypothetical protein
MQTWLRGLPSTSSRPSGPTWMASILGRSDYRRCCEKRKRCERRDKWMVSILGLCDSIRCCKGNGGRGCERRNKRRMSSGYERCKKRKRHERRNKRGKRRPAAAEWNGHPRAFLFARGSLGAGVHVPQRLLQKKAYPGVLCAASRDRGNTRMSYPRGAAEQGSPPRVPRGPWPIRV